MGEKSLDWLKYSATGNSFLIFDNRQGSLELANGAFWEKLASTENVDGLLFVENSEKYDFKMRYLNNDGGEVEMCGNGARAITHFYFHQIDSSQNSLQFETLNGVYKSHIGDLVKVQMTELKEVGKIDLNDLGTGTFSYFLNTGVPHCIFERENIDELDLNSVAAPVRHDPRFEKGSNVNFFERLTSNKIKIRTFERGVEGETLSCGTGITATSLALAIEKSQKSPLEIESKGGTLIVSWNDDFSEVFLEGPVEVLEKGSFNHN